MKNLRRRNESQGVRPLAAASALVVLLFVIDVVSGGYVRHEVRALAEASMRTLGAVQGAITRSGVFSSRARLEAMNVGLETEVNELRERAAASEALRVENESLRALLHLASTTSEVSLSGITAPVVSSTFSSPYGTFWIGAGSAEGVLDGDLVLTPGGFVVGTVTDAGAHQSVVSEVFAPNAQVDGMLDGATISFIGSGQGRARASIPRGVHIAQNDPVFAPAFGQRPVGIVGAIASSPASASEDVFVHLPVDLGALQYVYVISRR